jgi:outer membrane protein assembly factor BamD (BamD/ComL family)
MKVRFLVLLLGFALALSGCSGNKAEDLFETAKLEELQNAPEHAMKLYQEILDKYPESEYAQEAKERLSALRGTK